MHRTLYLEEILLNIFGHCVPPAREWPNRPCFTADLAALARTCRTFTEPALDILWEELNDMSLLAQCLPDACCFDSDKGCCLFRRPLTEAEWNTLLGYTRRVWHISEIISHHPSVPRTVFTLAPFVPLFPNLRSIIWESSVTLSVVHIAVPSLVSLRLRLGSLLSDPPLSAEDFGIIGERCPNIKQFRLRNSLSGSLDVSISRQLCLWKNLQCVECRRVTLSTDAVLHLCSMSGLTRLSFILTTDLDNHISYLGFLCVFSKLAILEIESRHLKSIINLFSRIQLPVIEDLNVFISEYAPRRDVRAYWTTVQKACRFDSLTHLALSTCGRVFEESIGIDEWLTLEELPPYRDFGNLLKMHINTPWFVKLTDEDLLDLVSTSPRLEKLAINRNWGWKIGNERGGITLTGLLQLLRRCPSLVDMTLVIDTRTFTLVPGQDVSFPQRRESFFFDFLDSHISPMLVPDLVSVFQELKLDPYITGGDCQCWSLEEGQAACALWKCVQNGMGEAYRELYSLM